MEVGVGPESESELESDNRNCQESESDDGTSDSTALVLLLPQKMLFLEFTWPDNRKWASSENQTLSIELRG